MVGPVTRPGPAEWPWKAAGEQRRRRGPTMTAAQKCSFFPQEPYYIPGYGGFYPQVRYHVGQSYGRTTSRMLTDPEVRKSPYSVLTPLKRPKFTEDFSQQQLPALDRMEQGQSYVPGYTGFVPYKGCFPIPGQSFQVPPLPRILPPPDPPEWTETHPAPLAAQRKAIPWHPGLRLACGPGWRQFAATASSQLVSPKGEERFLCHPDIALVSGQEWRGPSKTGMSLVCGQGWRELPCWPGTDQPIRTEGVPLPLATETVDIRRFDRTPKLDLPNLIQRKAISGYAGFIPCFTWIMGVNYLKGVKDAMNNFDRSQERLRNPLYAFGQRLPHTYWPNTKIYNSKGLVPFYTGFVPTISENYALTFGNSTRKAYYDEIQRRQHSG
ncbi:ciliary microtubule inner protein 2A [Erythrolamprus reginae]|uniref:ciliary microtubule inner protein 2A n=1 Tax=Erythrolamprus reginae TaxID=121349 RepID=UPI00396CECE3